MHGNKGKNICKIVIGGDGGTGKSTLLQTKKTGKFNFASKITVGINFECFPISCQGKEFTFLIYDLGGQKRFQFLHESYVVGSKAGIILYDLTRPKTFDNIVHWRDMLLKENSGIPLIIAGTKLDLVQNADIKFFTWKWEKLKKELLQNNLILDHLFISSKNYIGIDEIFNILATELTSQTISNQISKISL